MSKVKTEKYFNEDTNAYKIAILHYNLILKIDPGYKKPNFQKWAKEYDDINRLDGRSWKQITKSLQNAFNDKFWRTNILSPTSLRKHFTQLLIITSKEVIYGTSYSQKRDKWAAIIESTGLDNIKRP